MESNLTLESSSASLFGTSTNCFYDYQPWFEKTVHHYYPNYLGVWQEKSKIEQAFKIVNVLQNKKMIDLKTVKEFIEAVNEISSIL